MGEQGQGAQASETSLVEIEAALHAELDRKLEKKAAELEQAMAAAIADLRPIPGVDGPDKLPEPARYFDAGKLRRGFAYVLQAITLVAVLAIIGLELLWRVPQLAGKPPKDLTELYFLLALFGTQAVVSVAVVVLAMRVFRTAERMSLPHWWANDPARARLMLGEGPQRRRSFIFNVGLPGWLGGQAKATESTRSAPETKAS